MFTERPRDLFNFTTTLFQRSSRALNQNLNETLNQRWNDVDLKVCVCWVQSSELWGLPKFLNKWRILFISEIIHETIVFIETPNEKGRGLLAQAH